MFLRGWGFCFLTKGKMKEINTLLDMASRMVEEAKETKGKRELKVFLTSINQILTQIKELNVKPNDTNSSA